MPRRHVGGRARRYFYCWRSTSFPAGPRFEIIQSSIAARYTFKLDRVTGRIRQLVRNTDGDLSWEPMTVSNPPKGPNAAPHFQIFLSGIAARNSFLLDSVSGQVWVLTQNTVPAKDGNDEANFYTWEQVPDDQPASADRVPQSRSKTPPWMNRTHLLRPEPLPAVRPRASTRRPASEPVRRDDRGLSAPDASGAGQACEGARAQVRSGGRQEEGGEVRRWI
jgi:hypothetical protein